MLYINYFINKKEIIKYIILIKNVLNFDIKKVKFW